MLLALLCRSHTPLRAAVIAFAFGLGLHLAGHGWLFGTLFDQARSGWWGAAIGGTVSIVYLALFTALPCLGWRLLGGAQPAQALSFAALVTLGEYARSLLFNGVTGLSLGYALVDSPAAGWIPVLGVYGASFLAYLAASTLCVALTRRRRGCGVVSVDVGVGAAALLMLFGGGAALRAVNWVEPDGAPLRFHLVQSSIASADKFDPTEKLRHIDRTIALMVQAPADLIVTPETAFPVLLNQLPEHALERLRRFGRNSHSHLFLGIVVASPEGDGFNSMLHLSPRDDLIAQYRKQRLMPFGEYTPTGFGWFGALLQIPFKHLRAGPAQPTTFSLTTRTANTATRIATLLCQEDETGAELLRWLPQATLFINPADLSWFGGTRAIEQGLQRAQARAMESGRPILRVANGGVTAHIDHRGKVLSRLATMSPAVLAGEVQGMRGPTPFARFGNAPILVISVLIFVVAVAFCGAKSDSRHRNSER